ncbi:carbonic anhydrase [Kocuria sp. SM24M-10]|uniref:carbonic anhydrase n=1 Tax=Kocuria sp. SM24M-10 TaxID=1660349 RepID=UPI000699B0A0|nr:carbonic anhydrase family protein [Kocuria sp. SM24M-10]
MRSTSWPTKMSVVGSSVVLLATLTGCADAAAPDAPATPTATATVTAAPSAPEQTPAQWSYEGATGPQHWGELADEFTACSSGTAQSPIDVPSDPALSSAPIELGYTPADFQARDTGHTVELHALSPQSITVGGTEYAFQHMHYHAPSEHTVDGAAYAAEFHFVHRSDNGDLAVVGVLAAEGRHNAAWSSVSDAIPATAGEDSPAVTGLTLTSLLPESLDHYVYGGSLTTPPCSEDVRWLLLQSPIELGAAQIAALRSAHAGNNRPVQPLNDRQVSEVDQ